jgi:hypothetical protein
MAPHCTSFAGSTTLAAILFTRFLKVAFAADLHCHPPNRGIGLGFVERFLERGNVVIATTRQARWVPTVVSLPRALSLWLLQALLLRAWNIATVPCHAARPVRPTPVGASGIAYRDAQRWGCLATPRRACRWTCA